MPLDCPLQVVATEGFALAAPLATASGARDLPRGSLVRRTGTCAGGVAVEVVSVAGWVPVATPAGAGERGCVAAEALEDVGERVFVALAEGAGVAAGELLGPVEDAGRCDAATYAFGDADGAVASERALALADLAVVRAVDRETLAGVEAVRVAYAEAFGPIGRHRVPWTDWGRVGLPLEPLAPAEIEAEWAREGLDTPARREKAVVARGPAWLHFLGSDASGSDVWARPETVVALIRLARGWADHCAATVATDGDPARCTLQVGDLAWYNARTPDPLGHRDHAAGACVDLRLFRTDGGRYEAWWNRPDDRTGLHAYDAATTAAFLRWATANAPVTDTFFNDPAVVAQVPGVRALPGHDDHVHVCFQEERDGGLPP